MAYDDDLPPINGRYIPNESFDKQPQLRVVGSDLPPHNIGAEEAAIGAALLNPSAAVALAATPSEDFYSPANRSIVQAVKGLIDRGDAVDSITLAAELQHRGSLEEIGGAATLISLQSNTPSLNHTEYYLAIIRHHARSRAIIATADELRTSGMRDDHVAALTTLARTQAELVFAKSQNTFDFEDVGAVVRGEVEPITPSMLRRTDGVGLMYPGLLHMVFGEPGKGKTWIALHAATEAMYDGSKVLYLDWEGNRRIVGERFRALGMPSKNVDEFLLYLRPYAYDAPTWAALGRLVKDQQVALVVCDGLAKAMATQGLKENENDEALHWLVMAANPLTDAGAAVVLLHHVTKDREDRGLWPRGAGAWLGEVSGAAWLVKPHRGFSRNQEGTVDLVQAKDREGFHGTDGSTVASVTFRPKPEDSLLYIEVNPPPERDEGEAFRPTGLMEKISRQLEGLETPVSKMTIRNLLTARNDIKDLAIARLVVEGHLGADLPGKPKGYVLLKPFRESEDNAQEPLTAPLPYKD